MRLIEIITDLSMSKKKKKRSSWLLIASPSLLSIQQTNIRIGAHQLEQERYRESDRCAHPPVGMLPSYAPVYLPVALLGTAPCTAFVQSSSSSGGRLAEPFG